MYMLSREGTQTVTTKLFQKGMHSKHAFQGESSIVFHLATVASHNLSPEATHVHAPPLPSSGPEVATTADLLA
ncbi:hypothetical protein PR048_016158 [Dryococelus australis]|uniref:Uncharacterized protein n=1 Tax=Dryococelus australis TaxID=614101 RepID=A0ABQ9HJJ1_9NEOP|nr:hypothetical protein PR048_016158 [Dryococelus australis]